MYRFFVEIKSDNLNDEEIEKIDSKLDGLDINFEDGWIDMDDTGRDISVYESITYIIEDTKREKVEQTITEIRSRLGNSYDIDIIEDEEG